MSKVYSVCLYAGVLEVDDIAVSVLDTRTWPRTVCSLRVY
jgi:hypothetical protein